MMGLKGTGGLNDWLIRGVNLMYFHYFEGVKNHPSTLMVA